MLKRFLLGLVATEKPMWTRVGQTDTCWARAAETPCEYAQVKVF